MRDVIRKILKEETQEWEYQIRYIDGPVFYKRKKGETTWSFTTDKEFAENAHKCKIIKWDEKSD
jgi:predicted secreted Zn-dependent protease